MPVPYRETISRSAKVDYVHKYVRGAHGEFARVLFRIEPLECGKGFEYVLDATHNCVPQKWCSSVERGVRDAAETGALNGGEVVDCRVTFYDGVYHDVDSSDDAFYIAAREAFWEAMREADAKPAL